MSEELAQVFVRLRPDDTGFEADAKAKVRKDTAGLGVKVPIDADTKLAKAQVDDLRARVARLTSVAKSITVGLDDKQAKAAALTLTANLYKLSRTTATPGVTLEGATKVEAQLLATEAAFDKLGKTTDDAGVSATSLGGDLGRLSNLAMPALIGTAALLSPVIFTLGAGFGGLGLAALGLSKNQQLMARTLAPLKTEYGGFVKALQPQVLGLFNTGVRLAGSLLHDVQPVAKAAGVALGGVLTQIDREFQSGQWQQFFGFMARTAGPDIKIVGDSFTTLAGMLPSLLTDLQPVAQEFLQLADGALKGADQIVLLVNGLKQVTDAATTLGHHNDSNSPFRFLDNQNLLHGIKFVNDLLPRALQHAAEGAGALKTSGDAASKSTAGLGNVVNLAGNKAATSATQLGSMKQAVDALTQAESKSLTTQLAYSNALITSANDAVSLRQALARSGNQVGLHTQAQRDSFSAANTYIGDLVQTATKAIASGHGTDAASKAITNALPLLDSVATKNKTYWQEVRTLKQWLDKLAREKQIHELIKVTGTGNWASTAGELPGQPGMHSVPPGAAAGWLVHGGTPGRDSVLVNAMPGELIVPTPMVRAGAVDHLRGQIPGFSGGGIVPHYYGSTAGLVPWGQHNRDVTIRQITSGIAQSLASVVAAGAAFGGGGAGVARWAPDILRALAMLGQSSAWLGTVERRMNQESGGNPFAINLTDSNAAAGDPSRGLMQTIMATFLAYRSWSLPNNIYNPLANIFAGLNYALHRYGSLAALNRPGGYALGTGIGCAGLHWVGERGPELVSFRGGEQVLDSARSRRYGLGEPSPAAAPGGGDVRELITAVKMMHRDLVQATREAPGGFASVLNGGARAAAHGGADGGAHVDHPGPGSCFLSGRPGPTGGTPGVMPGEPASELVRVCGDPHPAWRPGPGAGEPPGGGTGCMLVPPRTATKGGTGERVPRCRRRGRTSLRWWVRPPPA